MLKALQILKHWVRRVKQEKWVFMEESVGYLGCIIDKNGRYVSEDRTKAVIESHTPSMSAIRVYDKPSPEISTRYFTKMCLLP